ncbi:MAG TPA: branched-chain amino acid ABC transporter ATP-binding protein/permease [Conexibacter sp.]|jgi:branched-chain amino acid transport system permease protein
MSVAGVKRRSPGGAASAAGGALRAGAAPWLGVITLIAFALVAPLIWSSDYALELMDLVVVYGVVSVSLNVMVGYLGYLPFSQIAFFGIGAYAGAIVAERVTDNLWVAAGAAIAVALLVSLVIGRLTLHLRGLYFAIVTLALAQLFVLAATNASGLTNGSNGLTYAGQLSLPLPAISLDFSQYRTVYLLTVVVAAVLLVGLWRLMRGGVGRIALALRDNEALARSFGVRATPFKLGAFVLVSVVASIAGVLYFIYYEFVSPGTFGLQNSLLLLLMIVLGGKDLFWAPLLGAVVFEVLPKVVNLGEDVKWLVFGAIMIAVVTMLPSGLGGAAVDGWRRVRGRLRSRSGAASAVAAAARASGAVDGRAAGSLEPGEVDVRGWARAAVTAPSVTPRDGIALRADGLAKRFGGVQALDGVSLELRAGGEVLGLVGPNGSGKTTLFNVLSGFVAPDSGTVSLFDHDVTAAAPERIAGLGLVRTFQEEAAFPTLTIAESALVARVGGRSRRFTQLVWNAMRAKPEVFPGSDVRVGELSHGSQRLLAIGLAFASAPAVVLLDEPAAGLGPEEAESVAEMIRLARDNGTSVVLIEHHMEMVMGVCDRVMVLGSGAKLAEGTPAEVTSDEVVVEAFLGSFGRRAVELSTSGTDGGSR